MDVITDDIDFEAYLAMTEPQQKVRPAREYVEELIANLGVSLKERRVVLPWQKTHALFAFRPGEVTLWAGVNGHGKSLITGMAMMSIIGQGDKACIASFEMKPLKTLKRMGRQFAGQNDDAAWISDPHVLADFKEIYEQFAIFADDRLWLYNRQGTADRRILIGVIRYAVLELGVNHFVIDSLMKCVAGEDDYNGQKAFVDELCALARDLDIHIHLVHHLRKLGSEADTPDKADVKGSGSITDQVDNLLLVWRNKKKERDAAVAKKVAADEPDAMLICDKQRNGEWEGRIALWYDKDSQQFVGANGARPLDFTMWPHHE